jgi:cytochrome c-type biogenesis protein CcmE
VKRKHKRLWLLISGLAGLAAVAAVVLFAFQDSIVYFLSPSDVAAERPDEARRFRLGGLVEKGSVSRGADGVTVSFRVTDTANAVPVIFRGLLPDLFREGQGVVAEGSFDAKGTFVASQVLAKHDEKYMPPEVAEALKKNGQWRGAEAK